MSQITSVSAENITSAPISNPKNLQEFGKMLDQQKPNISESDYQIISTRLASQQRILLDNAERIGFEKQLAPVYLKEQISALESAVRKEEAVKLTTQIAKIQAPAIQAAAKGDKKAEKTLGEVAQAVKPIDAKKAKESDQIVADTKVEVAKTKKDVVKTSIENTLQKQADSLIGYIEAVRPNLKGTEIVSDMKKWLSDTNIRSLVDHLVKNNVYVADGAYGPTERSMVNRMKDEYKKNPDFKEAIDSVYPILKS